VTAISPSRKSDSGSRSRPHPRRSNLKRPVDFHQITDDDMKFLWASHKKTSDNPLSPQEFKEQYLKGFQTTYDTAWIFEAQTKKGMMPIGVLYGMSAGAFLHVGDMEWFPWASTRNKLETMVNFFDKIRHEALCLFYSSQDDKDFYVHVTE